MDSEFISYFCILCLYCIPLHSLLDFGFLGNDFKLDLWQRWSLIPASNKDATVSQQVYRGHQITGKVQGCGGGLSEAWFVHLPEWLF